MMKKESVLLTRPTEVDVTQVLELVGKIESASIVTQSRREYKLVLKLLITAYAKTGKLPLDHEVELDWSEDSDLVALLKRLKLMPEPGCGLAHDAFDGLLVDLTIQNICKQGFIFEIIEIKKHQTEGKQEDNKAVSSMTSVAEGQVEGGLTWL